MADPLNRYYNQLLYRMEEVFHHELSDCAAWKTEFVGIDFIQSQEIKGSTEQEVIRSCIESIKAAGLAEDIEYSISGKGILLKLKIKGCPLMLKETLLRKAGIKPYNCPATNMILDQLIEKLGYATAYVADLSVNEEDGTCEVKAAIYATPEKVGAVSDWSAEEHMPHVGTGPSVHVDTFTRDNLPPVEQRPEFLFELAELRYSAKLNCAGELLDMAVAGDHAERPAIYAPAEGGKTVITYRQLLARSNQIANFLKDDLGLVPGNRVLLRSANHPMLAACLLGVWKAGGVAVPTMRLLRAKELKHIIGKAKIDFALSDIRLRDELEAAAESYPDLKRLYFNGEGPHSLESLIECKSVVFNNVDTAADDVALIAFTSGTTGEPKGTMHFHRDVLAMCDCWPGSILKPNPDDIFCGTAPLAFTYGLGTMLCVPLRFGASSVLVEQLTPAKLLQTVQEFRCTFCATVPTFYLQMAPLAACYDISSLRRAISSGEALPDATRKHWRQATGMELIDGLGTTEMIQTFLSHAPERARQGATGYAVPGYRATVLDDHGNPCPPGVVGRLAVKGPTGCLYLADERQKKAVQGGWNITGDAGTMDEEGYFCPRGRTDDMIVSAGYNIDGLEIESVLLEHEAVAECGVVGVPDEARGSVVNAFIVLKSGYAGGGQMAKALQDYVKSTIAPYKYPRRIEFVSSLPRTETGKLQRFKLVHAASGT